jgi:hypothetical protein
VGSNPHPIINKLKTLKYMACLLTQGRQEVCKESVGGLQGVYFINYTTGSFTKNGSGQVTALPSGSTVYYYELKGNSAYTETVNTSRDNGTTFFSQELTLNLKKLTNEMTTQLKLMAYGRPQIVVWTMNGEALLVGEREGADVTAGTIQTGGALGDLYGYSVTFTGMEQLPAAFLSGSTTTSPFAGLSTQPTIVFN